MCAMQRNWDIFCRVVDNYGDIGVCWRLARQLAAEHGLKVRLWVDDLASLRPLCPEINLEQEQQSVSGVCLCRWPADFPPSTVADVVLEAFACELPDNYRQAMLCRQPPPRWINLEYLSAEAWVERCHAIASPQPPLSKYFFFPGFSPNTGGLLRESGLLVARDAWRSTLPPSPYFEISLFCYDNAPVGPLLDLWSQSTQAIRCRVPPGKPLAAVQHHLGGEGPWQRGNLRVEPISFLRQEEYDHLLWSCDLNFARGEDSFVRAQWASQPFVWQIYPQQAGEHLAKLDAFLERYCAALPALAATAVRRFFHAWNVGQEVVEAWPDFLAHYRQLATHGKCWSQQLATQDDLVARLVKFCVVKL